MGRPLLQWTLFPATLVCFVAAAERVMERHDGNLVALAVFLATIPMFFALERLLPWRRQWLGSRGDVNVDVGLFGLAIVLGVLVVGPINTVIGAAGVGWLGERFGMGLWPSGWPLIAQGAVALLAGDFFRYWFHRAEHETALLWRLHATHHACERLYFFNGVRVHPLEALLSGVIEGIPLIVLGAPVEAVAMRAVMGRVIGRFQHCNLDVRLGPLDYVFSSPKNHRWHHSKKMWEANHNYGGDVIIWDHVFGTFFLPSNREPPHDIGIEDMPDFPKGLGSVLLSPFRWNRLARATS